VQRWLGHARISTTAIYADACGPEEAAFARKFWNAA
jgi:site-specific recombinase XerD